MSETIDTWRRDIEDACISDYEKEYISIADVMIPIVSTKTQALTHKIPSLAKLKLIVLRFMTESERRLRRSSVVHAPFRFSLLEIGTSIY